MSIPPAIERLRMYPGMYLPAVTLDCAIAFLNGYNAACQGGLLVGFREWLVVRANAGSNLGWSGLVQFLVEKAELDTERQIEMLFELLAAFAAVRWERDGLRRIHADYETWLRAQPWYTPDFPSWIPSE